MKLIFASNNPHKLEEVCAILAPTGLTIGSLNEVGFTGEVEETGTTFEENARIKVEAIYQATGENCFADDSGLEVEALDGRPGVYSARFAGEHGNHRANNERLLAELQGKSDRKACFKTVIALLWEGEFHFFEGRVDGTITSSPRGETGFGYDPVFVPEGYDQTFAEMPPELKNSISHRKRALMKMTEFLVR